MIEARDIVVHIGRRCLLDQVSLRVVPGELLAIVGPNGSGKSTLVRVLSGALRPTCGDVRMAGRALAAWRPGERARLCAVLAQQTALTFPFSVAEVVLLGRSPHLIEREGRRDRAIAALALRATGTDHLATRSYLALSGGEQQRVQLARVLAQIWEPPPHGDRYLLLDEPTSSLDLRHQHDILAMTRRSAAAGIGVAAVLHDLNHVARYADTVAVLDGGRIVERGPPAAVLRVALIGAVFGMRVSVFTNPEDGRPVIVPCGAAVAPPTTLQPQGGVHAANRNV